jgi:hypothetical protein
MSHAAAGEISSRRDLHSTSLCRPAKIVASKPFSWPRLRVGNSNHDTTRNEIVQNLLATREQHSFHGINIELDLTHQCRLYVAPKLFGNYTAAVPVGGHKFPESPPIGSDHPDSGSRCLCPMHQPWRAILIPPLFEAHWQSREAGVEGVTRALMVVIGCVFMRRHMKTVYLRFRAYIVAHPLY